MLRIQTLPRLSEFINPLGQLRVHGLRHPITVGRVPTRDVVESGVTDAEGVVVALGADGVRPEDEEHQCEDRSQAHGTVSGDALLG